MISIVYDARPLKPETRHWGVGEVIQNLLPELGKRNSVRGLSHTFNSSREMNIDTWPSMPLVNKLIFEFSPLFTGKFDVYWGTNTFIPGFFLNYPSIVTVHDMILFDLPGDQRASTYFQQRFISSIKRADSIITDSKTSADSLIHRFPIVKKKVEVGLLGYRKLKPDIQKINKYRELYNKPYVIMLGAPRLRKKLDLAIEAVRQVNDNGMVLDLLVTGNIHPGFESVIKHNRDLIITPGVMEKVDLLALLCNAQAMLFPTTYEGFGLPILEAMSMDCPVIASDIPIIREISGGAALLVSADSEDWTKAIKKVLVEKNYRNELISSAKLNLERFSWEKTGEIYNAVLKSVVP